MGDLALTAEDWKCVRQESFPDSRTNEYRHYRLADFSDNVSALPRCAWAQDAIMAFFFVCLYLLVKQSDFSLSSRKAACKMTRGEVCAVCALFSQDSLQDDEGRGLG